jgi:hypothetical protein
MQTGGYYDGKSDQKLKFKSLFKKLMETVDVKTGQMGRAELTRMEEQIRYMAEIKSADVRMKWPEKREIYFSSSVGQITFPDWRRSKVIVEDYSEGYVNALSKESFPAGTGRGRLVNKEFIADQIEDAIRRSVDYKSVKLYVSGKMYDRADGRKPGIMKLNLGMNARTDDLFFVGAVNGVDLESLDDTFGSNKYVNVYINNVQANGADWEGLDADYFGFKDLKKAFIARKALNLEMVNGKVYDPVSATGGKPTSQSGY